jgi:S1-C subfamily serine protease
MSLLDVVLVLVAMAAGAAGWTMGLISRLFSWLGLLLGLVVVSIALPVLLEQFDHLEEQWLLILAVLVVVATAMVGQAVGLLAGDQVRLHLDQRWDRVDSIGGAAMGVAGVALVVWLLAPAVRTVPGWSADQVENSLLVSVIETITPTPPDTFRTLRRIVGADQFPEVFAGEAPGVEVGAPPDSVPVGDSVVAATMASVVRVRAAACGQRQDGTGFFIEPGLVVTNAHVVAGATLLKVHLDDNDHVGVDAVTVAFDPDRDLAVLQLDPTGAPSLEFADGEGGDFAAVIGHPLGGKARVAPAQIAERVRARGRDLYDEHDTSRQVFFLAASLEPGDSGAPVIDLAGDVIGVVFAIAPDDPDVAFALTAREVRDFLDSQDLRRTVGLNGCL